jgi:hypothetical protein
METKGRIVVMSTWLIHPTWVPLVVFLPELRTHMHNEQQSHSLTCSGTNNDNLYDSNLSITTSPLTSSAPYGRDSPVQPLTCILSFCCKSGSNRKTQP